MAATFGTRDWYDFPILCALSANDFEGNLYFGLRNAGVAKAEVQKKVAQAAEILQIEALLKRKPSELSGGQRQKGSHWAGVGARFGCVFV